jgi:hypothetical protein
VGAKFADFFEGLRCVTGFAYDRQVGFGFKQATHTITEQGVIIDEDALD